MGFIKAKTYLKLADKQRAKEEAPKRRAAEEKSNKKKRSRSEPSPFTSDLDANTLRVGFSTEISN